MYDTEQGIERKGIFVHNCLTKISEYNVQCTGESRTELIIEQIQSLIAQ